MNLNTQHFSSDLKRHFSTPVGEILGREIGKTVVVSGIPYAHARRFENPTPHSGFKEAFDAVKPSAACPQIVQAEMNKLLGSELLDGLLQREDCQRLSITLPAVYNKEKLLPVMVWIHGGSYVSGAGDAQIYNPSLLVEEQQLIVVNVTYRLGVFGFLGDGKSFPANLGMLDVIEALKWVKNNIASFGGSPDQITLFGHSAGADLIANLMIAKGTKGLFRRLIIQSAPLGITLKREKMTNAMVKTLKSISRESSTEQMLSWQESLIAVGKKFGLKGGMPFGLQYGFYPLPAEDALNDEWEANATSFEILIGNTSEEAGLFLPMIENGLLKMPVLGKWIQRFIVNILTNKVYAKPALGFAKRHQKAGGKSYYYQIDWAQGLGSLGAAHSIDLTLLLGNSALWDKSKFMEGIAEASLIENGKRVRKIWADFAKNGSLPPKESIEKVISYYKI